MWEAAIKPFPASQAIPQWWKDATPYVKSARNPDGTKFILNNKLANTTFKKCSPMLDALTSGYILPLWADVYVEQVTGPDGIQHPYFSWRTSQDVFQLHGEPGRASAVEVPEGYSIDVFKYMNPWTPKTPLGYSILVTSPFGYRNTPLQAIPAIIDTDSSSNVEILPPVWIKKGFEGIIEKGTPIAQITPFKRDSWDSTFSYLEEGVHQARLDATFNSTLINHYVKNSWNKLVRKSYK
jgi:hypothetical protein